MLLQLRKCFLKMLALQVKELSTDIKIKIQHAIKTSFYTTVYWNMSRKSKNLNFA